MKAPRHILGLYSVLCILYSILCTPSFAQDYARLVERTLMGTARYIGMGGAMTAIGGDPSAAHDNPAGLGLYRRSEVTLSFDESLDKTQQEGNNYEAYKNTVCVPQASIVISSPTSRLQKGVLFHNVLFSYRRLHAYSRDIYASSHTPSPSMGYLLSNADIDWDFPYCSNKKNMSNSLMLNEYGYINEFAVNWAMNISDKWYVGAGIQLQSATFNSEAQFAETFAATNEQEQHLSNINNSSFILTSVGATGALGMIARPTAWLRLGFGLQTASIGALKTYTSGEFKSLTDSSRVSYAPSMEYTDDQFHMPWHISTSVAFQIGAYGMIAVQYDYRHQKNEYDTHSLRAGFEVIPVLGFYINGGYAYESTFKEDNRLVPMDPSFNRQDLYFQHPTGAHYASFALGYRGTHVLVQAAYQYRAQALRLWAHENANPYLVNADTHRIIVTIGWHRH